MMTREEKNKGIVLEIKREEAIKTSKKILKVFGSILLLFSLFFLYMYFIGTKGLQTNEYVIQSDEIPESFHGVKILHFSDLLYGKTINKKELDKLLEEIKKVNPNITIFTGNVVDSEYELQENDIKEINAFLKNIPYTIGKYAVKGNLDNTSFDLIFEDTNFIILNNEILDIYHNTNEKINLVGININEKTTINSSDSYTIALIHNYDLYHEYNISANVVFAGHNLGGEIRFFNIPILGENKYNNRYYEENNSTIYISSGLGSISHLRLFNKPSINVYRLYSK